MAKYAAPQDAYDPALQVKGQHLADADVYVDATLNRRGIDPSEVGLPNPLLTAFAAAWAKRLAAIDGVVDQDSPLLKKASLYEATAKALESTLTRHALGLDNPSGSGGLPGSIKIGRA
jgi:hypothetical protein